MFIIISILQFKNLIVIALKKFKDKTKILNFIIISVLLLTIVIKPRGIIDFEKFESKDKFIASREGGGSCNETLKLRKIKIIYLDWFVLVFKK